MLEVIIKQCVSCKRIYGYRCRRIPFDGSQDENEIILSLPGVDQVIKICLGAGVCQKCRQRRWSERSFIDD